MNNLLGVTPGALGSLFVAAALLFLDAASAFWAVPHRRRTAFLLITGAAILVTQSRSILLAAMVICGPWAPVAGAVHHTALTNHVY